MMKARILSLAVCILLVTAAALGHGGEEHVIGTVTKVTHNSITVQTTAKAAVDVQIVSETTFKKDNASASLKDVQVGDRVVIHAMAMQGGKLMAHTVEIGVSKKPPSSH
jgi:type 1 fimbria pilin